MEWMQANSEMPYDVLQTIYNLAMKTDQPDLVLAIIKTECNFNPYLKSSQRAIGLMGVTPEWWLDELKKKGIVKSYRELYDMENNIKAGTYILYKYFNTYKDINTVLTKYSGNSKGYAKNVFIALGEINYARMKGTW